MLLLHSGTHLAYLMDVHVIVLSLIWFTVTYLYMYRPSVPLS